MGVNVKRSLSLATVMVVSLVLLNLGHCRATSLGSNGNSSQCNNRMEECLIANGDLESEFMMDSGTNRMLITNFETLNTGQRGSPVVDCGRNNQYKPCLDNKGTIKPPENCGLYNRNC